MNIPSKGQILKLYRDLLKYGKQLQLTDKAYFENRIRSEFKQNKNIVKEDDIVFQYEVCYF